LPIEPGYNAVGKQQEKHMKAFLLSVMALFAMNTSAQATELDLQDLTPADELALIDGIQDDAASADEMLDQALLEDGIASGEIEADTLYPPRPRPPRPRPPYPRPPRPRPPFPPHPGHPYPHPNPPVYWYECASSDRFNNYYVARGTNPRRTQRLVQNRCENESGGYCYTRGCRRI
jgi:hypothetical protein